MERFIVHIDMDAFFAAVEIRDRPELAGKPVIVGAPPTSRRGVVSTCNYEARRYGVRSAQPIQVARRLCPHAVFLPVDMPRYRQVSRQVREVLERFTPLVEPISIDEAFLDMTPVATHYPDPQAMGQALKEAIREATGLTASVGIAPNKSLAKIACGTGKPDGLVVWTWEEAVRALAPMPVSELWGVGPKTAAQLERLGFRTVGDVQAASEDQLVRLLGDRGRLLARLAWGHDDRPVCPEAAPEKSLSHEVTFEESLVGLEAAEAALAEISEEVGRRLRRRGLWARRITLKLRFDPFVNQTRSLTAPQAFQSDLAIFQYGLELLHRKSLRGPIRLLGLALSELTETPQLSLFDRAEESLLDRLQDQLNTRAGRPIIRRARLLAAQQPDPQARERKTNDKGTRRAGPQSR
ncbi:MULTISPECIES: DNA polymerase IV [Limnochorda]|uniref:DNA polymerase IV n=1 Tax=Limnochorda TaxID=1676651 RepID=UPI001DDAF651|nr:DNA polymerase IV [Limnochorda pilosa]MBO2485800.1 DNA polymerase IV [Bacillota bacterium]MBO2519262.1 DNA polymerase IV [Bacillota bacterium]